MKRYVPRQPKFSAFSFRGVSSMEELREELAPLSITYKEEVGGTGTAVLNLGERGELSLMFGDMVVVDENGGVFSMGRAEFEKAFELEKGQA